MDKTEKTIKQEPIYNGRVINITKDEVLCPNGQESLREIVHHRGGVGILFMVEKSLRCQQANSKKAKSH